VGGFKKNKKSKKNAENENSGYKLSNKKNRSKKSFVFLELEAKSEKLSNGRFEVFVNVTL